MIVLLKRAGLFALILVAALWLIKQSVPYYWGNDLLEHKLRYLEQNLEDYDALFVGSSHVCRQVDVEEFDKLTGHRSYNLGVNGMFALEANYMLEKFLEKNAIDRGFSIFLQKTEPTKIAKKNLHSNQGKYFMDLHRFRIALTHYWKRGDWKQIYYHFVAFLENKLAIGQIREIIKYHWKDKKEFHPAINQNHGFYSLEQQLKLESDSRLISRRHGKYKSSKQFKENKPVAAKEKRMKMAEISDEMIYLRTKEKDSIRYFRFSSIKLDPEYYFDRGHFNDRGSRINTEKMAQEYKEKVQ